MTDNPAVRHRKANRTAARDLHRLASKLKKREGTMPLGKSDLYIDAFSAKVRAMALLCETKGLTCSQVKIQALASRAFDEHLTDKGQADLNGINALLVLVNLHARQAGLDPFEGLRK